MSTVPRDFRSTAIVYPSRNRSTILDAGGPAHRRGVAEVAGDFPVHPGHRPPPGRGGPCLRGADGEGDRRERGGSRTPTARSCVRDSEVARRSMATCSRSRRQPVRDLEHVVELRRRLPGLPGIVVAVLVATRSVHPAGLDVAKGPQADPHVPPPRGMASAPTRASAAQSRSGPPPGEVYDQLRPRRDRVMPGAFRSDRRSRALVPTSP